MKRILWNLIKVRYYPTKEAAQEKVDVVFALNKLTEEQYTELTMFIEEMYPEAVAEESTPEA